MSDDDTTPAPVPGETVDQYHRRVTSAFAIAKAQKIDPEKTKLEFTIIKFVTILVLVVSATASVLIGYWQIKSTVDQLGEKITAMASMLVSKIDLAKVRDDTRKATRALLRAAVVECPRQTARGESVASCKVRLPDDE